MRHTVEEITELIEGTGVRQTEVRVFIGESIISINRADLEGKETIEDIAKYIYDYNLIDNEL